VAVDVGCGIDRLLLRVERGGREIGCVELPGGTLPADVVAAETLAAVTRAGGSPPHVGSRTAVANAAAGERYGRDYFETIFDAGDPWDAASDYERSKAERTLSLLPAGRPRQALEVGCAGGHFTAALARRVDLLLAVDLSERALAAARERCA